MKIYAARTRYENEFLPYVGKDFWVKVVSNYSFKSVVAGVPFWLKIFEIKQSEPATKNHPARYVGLGYQITDENTKFYQGDVDALETINSIGETGFAATEFNFSDGSIRMVTPLEVATSYELFGIGEEE